MGSSDDRWRIKNQQYPSYSFSLNRETQNLQDWVEKHKAAKQLPAVVRMGLLVVRMLEERGCPVPEDDPDKLRMFLDILLTGAEPPGRTLGQPTGRPPKIEAGDVREEQEPESNLDDFLKGL